MEIMKKYKERTRVLMALLFLICLCIPGIQGKHVSAASAMIEFSAETELIKRGDEFVVTIKVSADEAISSADIYVSYDQTRMAFLSGGKNISGAAGLLHINASSVPEEKSALKYSAKFRAITTGDAAVALSDRASIKNSQGVEMATSSNRFSFNIKNEGGQTTANQPVTDPGIVIVPTTPPSTDNRLSSLKVSAGALEPEFNPDVTTYSLEVTNDVTALYFSYNTAEHHATVSFIGNEDLKEGKNMVRVNVTAQNGDKREYIFKVKRETSEQYKNRLREEADANNGIHFEVTKDDEGYIYLQNQYRFQIMDVDESTKVPAGYKKTSVLLYGVDVTAYTVASNLDSDYLLMYCKNAEGDVDFYQYDRQEKTLQRYTGDMIEKINAQAGSTTSDEAIITSKEYRSNLNQLAIIVAGLVAVSVMLLIIIISLLLKMVRMKSKRIEDELDF